MQLIKKMILLFWLRASLYQDVYNYFILFLVLVIAYRYSYKTPKQVVHGSSDSTRSVLWLMIAVALFIGLRPLSGAFGDMYIYYMDYRRWCSAMQPFDFTGAKEPGWILLYSICRTLLYNQPSDVQFEAISFICSVVYVCCAAWACIRLDRRHAYVLFLFVLSSFSFFAYGTNGMRNGMACSIILLALSFICTNFRGRIIAIVLVAVAYSIHRSAILPGGCMILSYYLIRNPKISISFWLISIVLSLLIGSEMEGLLTNLDTDTRLRSYLAGQKDAQMMQQFFSKVGFRWDFLLFSCMPILLGWYIVMKREIKDRKYLVLLNTYILSNAFWVMVIRAMNSNRFAYLSWFMYGLVLAYPLVNFKIYKNQGAIIGVIAIAQMVFTMLF